MSFNFTLIPRHLKNQDLFFYAMPCNHPDEFGLHSVAAAVIFAVLYIPLFGWFVRQSFARLTYVHFVLVLFCAST